MNDEKPTILIAGTGAMACLFSARLSEIRVPVIHLGTWSAGLEALRRDGVHLVEADGNERVYPVRVITDPLDAKGVKYALVLVKSWQTGRVAHQLASCLAEDGLALTLQNGLGNREALAETLGSQRAALGVTTTGATLLAPGRVRAVGDGMISLGVHPRIEPIAGLLTRAGFVVETVTDTETLLWGKLVINAAINPLTALLDVPNGELLARSNARAVLGSAAREAAAVAVARGIRLPYPDPVAIVETVARRTATNSSSMRQDVKRGAPTEVDAINGAITRSGDEHSVPTPINRTLWQLTKALVDGGTRDAGLFGRA